MKIHESLFVLSLLIFGFFSSSAQYSLVPIHFIHQQPWVAIAEEEGYFTSVKPLFLPAFQQDSISVIAFCSRNTKKTFSSRIKNKLFSDDLLYVDSADYFLSVNPLFNFSAGKESGYKNQSLYNNSRGILLRGEVSGKIFFYSLYTENQSILPAYQQEYVNSSAIQILIDDSTVLPQKGYGVVQGMGRSKPFKTSGYDYGYAQAKLVYIPFRSLSFSMAYDKLFIGEGYRSVFISDFSSPFPYASLTYENKRIQHVFLCGQLYDLVRYKPLFATPETFFFRKMLNLHYTTFALHRHLHFSLFEATVFPTFYLQPASFNHHAFMPLPFYNYFTYKDLPAKGIAKTGIGAKWYWQKAHTTLYAQYDMEDMKGKAWAYQVGIKKYFLKNRLVTWVERNQAYHAHQGFYHTNENLVHPFGTSYEEWVGGTLLNYKRIFIYGTAYTARQQLPEKLFRQNLPVKDIPYYVYAYGQEIKIAYILNPATQFHFFLQVINREHNKTHSTIVLIGINTNLVHQYTTY